MAMNAQFLDGPAFDMIVPVARTPMLLRVAVDDWYTNQAWLAWAQAWTQARAAEARAS
jgi:hypothetical protein